MTKIIRQMLTHTSTWPGAQPLSCTDTLSLCLSSDYGHSGRVPFPVNECNNIQSALYDQYCLCFSKLCPYFAGVRWHIGVQYITANQVGVFVSSNRQLTCFAAQVSG